MNFLPVPQMILLSLLISLSLPTLADAPSGIIVLTENSSTDSLVDDRRRRRIEHQLQLNCEQEGSELKCLVSEKSVWRESPKMLAIWKYVTETGQLTEKGKDAFKQMRTKNCAILDSIDIEAKTPNPEYAGLAKNVQSQVIAMKNHLEQLCGSEHIAAVAWVKSITKELKDEADTCSISGWAPTEVVFKQIGKDKWIRSVGEDDLITLTSGPLFVDGTGRGWTYVAEGTKFLGKKKPWKYVYKGTEETFPRGFRFSSLKDCKTIIIK